MRKQLIKLAEIYLSSLPDGKVLCIIIERY